MKNKLLNYINIAGVLVIYFCFITEKLILDTNTSPLILDNQINIFILGLVSLLVSSMICLKFNNSDIVKINKSVINFNYVAVTILLIVLATKYLLNILDYDAKIMEFLLTVTNAINTLLLFYTLISLKIVKRLDAQ